MKQETKEALALELTKAVISERSKNEGAFDITDAELWVHIYMESLDQIEKGYKEQMACREPDLEVWEKL